MGDRSASSRSPGLLVAVLLAAMAACSPADAGGGRPRADAGGPTSCTRGVRLFCAGTIETSCDGAGNVTGTRDCAALGLTCASAIGCRVCEPGRGSCDGNTTRICRADGGGWDPGPTCDQAAGESCNATTGQCSNLCRVAEESRSYIGCEYWPVTTMNASLAPEFEFAVAVANPQAVPATVSVDRAGAPVASVTVAPGALETITLPYVPGLKGVSGAERSILVPGAAYHLVSSVPVTVYQFNALEYRIARDCANEADLDQPTNDGQCFSFTNDASLLLPTAVLSGNYIVASRASQTIQIPNAFGLPQMSPPSPGFFTVVGAEPTPVTVSVTFRAFTMAADDGSVAAYRPGDVASFTLGPGDVLQVASGDPGPCPADSFVDEANPDVRYCANGRDYDLTGTELRASGRVSVISGHSCAFVPYYRWACDHLEEAIFPLEAWGKDVLVPLTQPLRGEPNVVRVISGRDGNVVNVDPPIVPAATMARGEIYEFEASQDVRVTGSEALLVVQHLVGQDYAGLGAGGEMGAGDPSMSLAIPTEQFRSDYTVLAPLTYQTSFVNVTAPAGQSVLLDGAPVGGFTPIGATGYAAARVMVAGGVHSLSSGVPFGVSVYGFGSYTSYMYPGGLEFRMINIPF